MDPLVPLIRALRERSVRFVVIGVAGANYYAHSASALFTTQDRDLFLPPDPANLARTWEACEAVGLELLSGPEPLGVPRDLWVAERVVAARAAVRATDRAGLDVDLALVMAGFDFETVWEERRTFVVEGEEVPVARLLHIVSSKHVAGRDKDRLFLAAHRDALRELLHGEG